MFFNFHRKTSSGESFKYFRQKCGPTQSGSFIFAAAIEDFRAI